MRYRPDATAPMFCAFLEHIFPDPAVRAYMGRFVGYSLTGDVSAQMLGIWWGAGSNGKSTLLSIIEALLGTDNGYATTVGRDLLTVQHHENHDTRYVDLFRARLASCVELRDGAALDEARVKMLTGGDTIRARRMREDYWRFRPTHKLIIATNHRPQVRADDYATWRRVHLVPFTTTIPKAEADEHLAERIIADELPGILTWALDGCAQWRQAGLAPPPAVVDATSEYRQESDTVARFIADIGLVARPASKIASSDLRGVHDGWCEDNALLPERHWKLVAARLREMGGKPGRSGGGRYWSGIALTSRSDAL